MSFHSLSARGCPSPSQLTDLDDLMVTELLPRSFHLRCGDARPSPHADPLSLAQARSCLAEANEELHRVENHVLTQRWPLSEFLRVRFERYAVLKNAIAAELRKQPFERQQEQKVREGLSQFKQATWALRQLLAASDNAQLDALFKEAFQWTRVAIRLNQSMPAQEQVRRYGETFDSLLCRFERMSTLSECAEVLDVTRARLGSAAAEQLPHPSATSCAPRSMGTAAPPVPAAQPAVARSAGCKRPRTGSSPTGALPQDPAGGAEPNIKRALTARPGWRSTGIPPVPPKTPRS